MKKVFLVLIAVIGLSIAAEAQNAIGLRLGGGQGFNTEISYQKAMGSTSRLEADLGYNLTEHVGGLSFAAIYQVHFGIPAVENLGWYAGVGGRLLLNTNSGSTSTNLGAVGQVGIDYALDVIPLQFSLDIRPCFFVYPATDLHWGDVALGIRYMF